MRNAERISLVAPTDESDRRTVRRLKNFAKAGQWTKLLGIARKKYALRHHPTVIAYQLRASAELRDQGQAKIYQKSVSEIDEFEKQVECAQLMVKWKYPQQAADILLGLPMGYQSAAALSVAKRIKKISKNAILYRKIKRHLKENLSAATGPVTHRFPTDTGNFNTPPSRLEVTRVDSIPQELQERVSDMLVQFQSLIAHKKVPLVTEYKDVCLDKFGKPQPMAGDAEKRSAVIYDEAFSCLGVHKGYFEWIVRRLSGLSWRLDPSTPDCPILVRIEQHGLALDALVALGVPEDKIIAIEEPVNCRRLYVSAVPIPALARTDAYDRTYKDLIAAAERQNDQETPRRFYISRRDSTRRSMANEAEFESALIERGITPVILSEMLLLEKINLFRNAELVVGAHGAGFSHLVFAKPGLRVIEIMPTLPKKFGFLGMQSCFARLSAVFGHHHTFMLHLIDPATSEWSPDLTAIDRQLAYK